MLLKSRASLICFRACFLPGRAKDLSAPRVFKPIRVLGQKAATDVHSTNTSVSLYHLLQTTKLFSFIPTSPIKLKIIALKLYVLLRWVHKFPACHTKTAPNAKFIVRLLYQFQVATCSSMLEALVLVGRVVVSC